MNDTNANNAANLGASPVSPLNPINVDPAASGVTSAAGSSSAVPVQTTPDPASLPVTPPKMPETSNDDNPFFRKPSVTAPVEPTPAEPAPVISAPASITQVSVGPVVSEPVKPVETSAPAGPASVEPEPFNPTISPLPKEFWGPSGPPQTSSTVVNVKPIPVTETVSSPVLPEIPKVEPVVAPPEMPEAILPELPKMETGTTPEIKPLETTAPTEPVKPVETVKPDETSDALIAAEPGNNRLKNILLLLGVLVLGIISLLAGIIVASNQ